MATLHLRHLSALPLTAGIASLFILLAGFRRGQRWPWWALLFLAARDRILLSAPRWRDSARRIGGMPRGASGFS